MDRSNTAAVAEQRSSTERNEARAVLTDMARERFGAVPAELVAEHVLGLDPRADWPVLAEALNALRRRWAFAERDELKVSGRPASRHLGQYATRVKGRAVRPYRTLLEGLQPLRASCGCPDFRRSSLGLCKHLLVVLDALARKPRTWSRALAEASPRSGARLAWSPLRPLLGADDWLERVRLIPEGRPGHALARAARHFEPGVGAEWVLRRTHAGEPRKRLALVKELAEGARGGDPALEARSSEEISDLERCLRLARRSARMERSLGGLKRELYPYQREGVERFLARGRLLLADDMGLGKTVQAVAACHALLGAGLVERGLLVVPAPLKHQWLREWRETSDAAVEVVEGGPEERARIYQRTRRGFLIANYEQLLRDMDLIHAWDPGLCVLDEAQRIKNWAAKTSHAVKALRPEFRLVLTGTPLENRLEELASIVEWVDDHALEPKWRLVPLHTQTADGERGISGARHMDTLRARLAPCTLRRVRREVLAQLPGRTDTRIPIDLTAAQHQAHDDLDRPIASLLKVTDRRALTQQEFLKLMRLLLRQRQICNGLALADFAEVWPAVAGRRPSERLIASLDSPKLLELRALVESLVVDQGRKVVMFSQWRRMLELAAWATSDLLAAAGSRAVFFTGKEGARRRTQNIVDFHDDPTARILLATDAGGVGLNLQRAASACVLLELPWNPAVLEQRIGRIHRLGQTEPVEVYAIVSRGGIEERIASLVADKLALFRGLFDGESDEVLFDRSTSFLSGLREARASGDAAAPGAVDVEEDPDSWSDETALADEADETSAVDGGVADDARPDLDGRQGRDGSPAAPSGAADLARLFDGLHVDRTAAGGIRIEAPPESAGALIALLEGLVGALRGGGRS